MTRIAVIIPDRGDRPYFMANCLRMMENQTLKPVKILPIDWNPSSGKVDITDRYRAGYEFCGRHLDVDLIAFIENDDYYCPEYLNYMANKWNEYDRPNLFGTNYTIYYHLKLRKYFTFRHIQRSSAMSTFIRPGLNFIWPLSHDPYTDQWLWMRAEIPKKVSFEPEYIICVGMKHGVGMSGGEFHTDALHHYINEDGGFLKNNLDVDSYKFYSELVL